MIQICHRNHFMHAGWAAHATTAVAVAMAVAAWAPDFGGERIVGPDRLSRWAFDHRAAGARRQRQHGHARTVGTMPTTQQAADMLNVSRPHLTKLLKEGSIDFEEVGKHRRVPLDTLMAYRDRKRRRREDVLDELAHLGQEFDQG